MVQMKVFHKMIQKQRLRLILAERDERIDWTKSAKEIHNHIRGLSPWPVAYTTMNDKNLKLYQAHIEKGKTENQVKL